MSAIYKNGTYYGKQGGGGASDLSDLGDVNLNSPADGEVLKYDASSGKWVNDEDAGGADLSPEEVTLIKQNFQVNPYGSMPTPMTETDVLAVKNAFVIV